MEKVMKQIAEHLGIEALPIKYKAIEPDDSRLYIKERFVAINTKYQNNEIETIKSIITYKTSFV